MEFTILPYTLAQKAFAQMEDSYKQFGGMPEQLRNLVTGANRAIDFYIDRPEGEKDGLMAATALFFGADMTAFKELPENVDEYGAQVKQILEDALANPSKPYGASPDLMQIGLALAIPMKQTALSMLAETKEKIAEIADESPDILRMAIGQMKQAVKKSQQDGNLYFTGAQPRLEAEAKKVSEAIKIATEDLIRFMDGKLNPPAANGNAKPARPPQP